jgi:hypothetical protein
MYFIKDKKYTRNPKESDRCPEATAGPDQKTVSCLQDRLRTGGPKQETLLLPNTLQLRLLQYSHRQLCLQLQSTTPIYYSALQSLLPINAEDPPTKSTNTTTTVITEVVFAFRAKNF